MNKLSSSIVVLALGFLSSTGWTRTYQMTLCISNGTSYKNITFKTGAKVKDPHFAFITKGRGYKCKNIEIEAASVDPLTVALGQAKIENGSNQKITCADGSGTYSYVPASTTKIEILVNDSSCTIKYLDASGGTTCNNIK